MAEQRALKPRWAGVRGHVPGVFLRTFAPMRDADALPLPRLTPPCEGIDGNAALISARKGVPRIVSRVTHNLSFFLFINLQPVQK